MIEVYNRLTLSKADYSVYSVRICVLVTQSCLTLFNLLDYSSSGSSVHGIFLGKNTEVSRHSLLQGIFHTQGPNLGLLHYRQILSCLSHQGSPKLRVGRVFSVLLE